MGVFGIAALNQFRNIMRGRSAGKLKCYVLVASAMASNKNATHVRHAVASIYFDNFSRQCNILSDKSTTARIREIMRVGRGITYNSPELNRYR